MTDFYYQICSIKVSDKMSVRKFSLSKNKITYSDVLFLSDEEVSKLIESLDKKQYTIYNTKEINNIPIELPTNQSLDIIYQKLIEGNLSYP